MPTTRLMTVKDAPALAELFTLNRAFLAPWSPTPPDGFFTTGGQRRAIEEALDDYKRGTRVPHVIVDGEVIVGRITLSNIVRGAFQSCNIGYWVDGARNGRGLASAAVREITELAFGDLGLHRVEAGTLRHNLASQRVLERNGFERFGVAPEYLRIAGRWQDHILYQALNPTMR